MNLNFKFSKSSASMPKIKLSLALWGLVAIIAVLAGLVIFKEVRKVTGVQTDSAAIFNRIVRVNMAQYKDLETRLTENSSFEPQPVPGAEAFSASPELQDEE
jgi:hypothetical protein